MDLITTGIALTLGKKLLGKTLDVISDDIANLYKNGRDKIIDKTTSKIPNLDDGKTANLRVTRDVFWNGSFTDEEICAEYFGGILASSRSKDGKDDSGVYYVDLIKSLSSEHLKLHYLIYHSFNKYFFSESSKSKLNLGQESELIQETIFFSMDELLQITGIKDPIRDLHVLLSKGLIASFEGRGYKLNNGKEFRYLRVSPKPLGIQLYAVAHNKLDEWRNFSKLDFGNFNSINSPTFHGKTIEELLINVGIDDNKNEFEKESKYKKYDSKNRNRIKGKRI